MGYELDTKILIPGCFNSGEMFDFWLWNWLFWMRLSLVRCKRYTPLAIYKALSADSALYMKHVNINAM